jgi:tetratricopeptide (TPR) repeat protein
MAGPGIEADIPPESSSQKGRLQGVVRLSGQLSADFTLREVLQQVRELSDQYGLVRILSKGVRGYIGITNSHVISGGYVTSTSEYGIAALHKLLAAGKGIFVVMAMSDHPIELRQSLKLSIDDLLAYRPAGQETSLADALLFFETRHGELFTLDAAAHTAATSGGELAEFESYMAWGGEAPVLENNLSKITGSFGKAMPQMPQTAQTALPPKPQPPVAQVIEPQPAQPNMGWAEDQSRKVMDALDRAVTNSVPIAVPIEEMPEVPGMDQSVTPQAVQKPGLRRSSNRMKPVTDVPKGDDEQSISQKISRLREEQTASQKLNLEDLEDEIQRPVNALSPAERRKHEIISISMWLAGLGLVVALGQQIFSVASASASYQTGIKALKDGDYARAQVDLTHAIDAGAGQRAYLYRAIAESRLGHGELAQKDFDELLSQNPKDNLARAAKAALLIRERRYQEAITQCQEIIKTDDQNGDAYRLMALSYCAIEDWKSAIDTATQCMGAKINDKGRAEALCSRAYAYYRVNKNDQALEDYTDGIKLDPSNAQLFASRALVYKKLQNWQGALADVSKAIELDGNNVSLYKLRAECYKRTGMIAKAAADLDKLAKLKPSMDAFKMRAAARLATKNFEGALEDYEYILKVDPMDKDAKAGYQSAMSGLTSGKPIALADYTKKETAAAPTEVIKGTPAELTQRGYTALNAGRPKEAAAILAVALKGDPGNMNTRRYLAYAFFQSKDYTNAGAQLEQLSRISTLSTEDRVMYGKCLYLQRKYDQAARMYGTVLAQYPTNDDARQGLINSLIDCNRHAEAVALCQEGMTRNPAMAATYKMLLNVALHPVDQRAMDKFGK